MPPEPEVDVVPEPTPISRMRGKLPYIDAAMFLAFCPDRWPDLFQRADAARYRHFGRKGFCAVCDKPFSSTWNVRHLKVYCSDKCSQLSRNITKAHKERIAGEPSSARGRRRRPLSRRRAPVAGVEGQLPA